MGASLADAAEVALAGHDGHDSGDGGVGEIAPGVGERLADVAHRGSAVAPEDFEDFQLEGGGMGGGGTGHREPSNYIEGNTRREKLSRAFLKN